MTKPGTSPGAIPEKLSVSDRASVIAGLAKLVDGDVPADHPLGHDPRADDGGEQQERPKPLGAGAVSERRGHRGDGGMTTG